MESFRLWHRLFAFSRSGRRRTYPAHRLTSPLLIAIAGFCLFIAPRDGGLVTCRQSLQHLMLIWMREYFEESSCGPHL
jgi:hypothetical protein